MIENESRLDKLQQKAKIRERYKGIDPGMLEVIPAKKQADFYDDEPRRVAVYVRVSTDDPRQTSSYELQKNYYEDMVEKHPGWALVSIYPDEGISGTSLQHRDSFNRMIVDCKAGKIDLIVTKSVSRFARNIVDCISIVRELASLKRPVGVFFETEHIFTLKDNSEMSLSFTATMAQEESHVKSTIMNASLEMRFSHGIVLTPLLLGYDHDNDGNLVINETEAQTVRLIFFMYLYGYTCQHISDALSKIGCVTKKGNTTWAVGSILQILRNERYCGDILTRKTYTPNYLNHKVKRNMGDKDQHRWKDHHDPIVTRDDYIAVQHLINNAKYGNKGILPELQVIPAGALRGFVSVNPRWAGFCAEDYIVASDSVAEEKEPEASEPIQVEAQSGDFDLRGFEIARSQFFDTAGKLCVNFSMDGVIFSTACIRKFSNAQYIEMLIHPSKHLLAIRACKSTARNALHWAVMSEDGQYTPRAISGAAFLHTLYDLFGWNGACRYRVRGIRRQKDNETVIVFDMRETELFVPASALLADTDGEVAIKEDMEPIITSTAKSLIAYPSAWADNFGSNYYSHVQARELASIDLDGAWQISEETQPFSTMPDLKPTAPDEAELHIKEIIRDIRKENTADGCTRTQE